MHRGPILGNRLAIWLCGVLSCLQLADVRAEAPGATPYQRMVEWSIESSKHYADPFNDVDVDVVFARNGRFWRVPTFWRGGDRWTVRFAPPQPGKYSYHLESTDADNPDLNGHPGEIEILAYAGASAVLRHGAPRVSDNLRHFEYADGTPFFWLGDTWWTGLSSRLSWEDFQRLTLDRKTKGFTVVQTVAGLVPGEEICPADPGCGNEGGAVWDAQFKHINPAYFDSADRRIEYLLNSDITPAIVGGWGTVLEQIGVSRMKQHWRYLIARYGAYPVFWIGGGEVFDPPAALHSKWDELDRSQVPGGWSEVVRYIRATDPYHHPVTVHETSVDNPPLRRESLTDFRLFQPNHFGWPSIAVEVAQLTLNFARPAVIKPLVVGEIGYEMLGSSHLEDFQRVAFWLAMLNGAAGFTYGAAGTWESYTADKPFPRIKWSFMTWDEGMSLPGSYQVGIGAKLLQLYNWWQLEPHPEWVVPRGTTLFEPRGGVDRFHIDVSGEWGDWPKLHVQGHASLWESRAGNFRLPYTAGVPTRLRVLYLPYFGFVPADPPTVLALEAGVRYHAFYWEPSLGIRIDLGSVGRPTPGPVIWQGRPGNQHILADHLGRRLSVIDAVSEPDVAVSIGVQKAAGVGVLLRFQDPNNYVSAEYSATQKAIYIVVCKDGKSGKPQGWTAVPDNGAPFQLLAEVRGSTAIVSYVSKMGTQTSPIVDVPAGPAGPIAIASRPRVPTSAFDSVEVRRSPTIEADSHLERYLYDARGRFRGELAGPGGPGITGTVTWESYGKDKHLLLDAYRPELLPTPGDWVLILASESPSRAD